MNLHNSSAIYLVEDELFFNTFEEIIDYLENQYKGQLKQGDDFELLIAPVFNISGKLTPDLASKRIHHFLMMNKGLTLVGNNLWSQY